MSIKSRHQILSLLFAHRNVNHFQLMWPFMKRQVEKPINEDHGEPAKAEKYYLCVRTSNDARIKATQSATYTTNASTDLRDSSVHRASTKHKSFYHQAPLIDSN